jgi:hypothetical protein
VSAIRCLGAMRVGEFNHVSSEFNHVSGEFNRVCEFNHVW